MKIENGIRSETINISDNKIIKKEFDAYEYERIKLDYETVKQRIYDYKSHFIEIDLDGNILQNKIIEESK